MATAPQAEIVVKVVAPPAAHDCLHPDEAIDQTKHQPHGSEQQQVPLEEEAPFKASWPQGQVYMMMYKRTDPDPEVGGVHQQGPVQYAVSDNLWIMPTPGPKMYSRSYPHQPPCTHTS